MLRKLSAMEHVFVAKYVLVDRLVRKFTASKTCMVVSSHRQFFVRDVDSDYFRAPRLPTVKTFLKEALDKLYESARLKEMRSASMMYVKSKNKTAARM